MGVLKILKPTKMEKVENYNLDITKSDIVADKKSTPLKIQSILLKIISKMIEILLLKITKIKLQKFII